MTAYRSRIAGSSIRSSIIPRKLYKMHVIGKICIGDIVSDVAYTAVIISILAVRSCKGRCSISNKASGFVSRTSHSLSGTSIQQGIK